MRLPDLQDDDRTLDLRGAPRYPWIALYRRATAATLLASVRADLEDATERTLARVIVQDGNAVRHVLVVTNRGMQVLSLSPKDGEQGLTQRGDRGSLAVNLFFLVDVAAGIGAAGLDQHDIAPPGRPHFE